MGPATPAHLATVSGAHGALRAGYQFGVFEHAHCSGFAHVAVARVARLGLVRA